MVCEPSNASTICIQDLNFVITVPADGLAPNGARPSVGTLLTAKLAIVEQTMNRQIKWDISRKNVSYKWEKYEVSSDLVIHFI